jgi:hypothetical protein
VTNVPGLIKFLRLGCECVSLPIRFTLNESYEFASLHGFQNWNRAGGDDTVLIVSALRNTRVYAFGVFRTNLVDLFQLHW